LSKDGEGMKVRANIIVRGRVRGVGFRHIVDKKAYFCQIKGKVWNESDGTVRMICEGEQEDLARFIKGIRVKQWPIMVTKIKVDYSKATGQFKGFEVIRGEYTTKDIIERLDLGLEFMRESFSEQSGKQDRTIGAIDGLSKKQDKTIGAIEKMDIHMGKSFGRLDHKYDGFGRTMKVVARDIRAIRQATVPQRKRRAADH
jgi:acylphosphatase